MSVEAVKWVLEHSPTTGADRLVLLILAEETRVAGGPVYLGPATIARRANVNDPRWVKRVLKRLLTTGAIEAGDELHPKYGTRPYTVATRGEITTGVKSPPGSNDTATSGETTPGGVVISPPKPELPSRKASRGPRGGSDRFDKAMMR